MEEEIKEEGKGEPDWTLLPSVTFIYVLSFLNLQERRNFACTCKTFQEISKTPILWKSLRVCFKNYKQEPAEEEEKDWAKVVSTFGPFINNLWINVDTSVPYNCRHALVFLSFLKDLPDKLLKYLKITFYQRRESKIFYDDGKYLNTITSLLKSLPSSKLINECQELSSLTHLDLSNASITIDDIFIDALSKNSLLECLNIQTYPVNSCSVTPKGIIELLKKCKLLKHLAVYKISVSEAVIHQISESQEKTLESLSLRVTEEDAPNTLVVSSEAWEKLAKSKRFYVELAFDAFCSNGICSHLNPKMPVSCIKMESTAFVYYNIAYFIHKHFTDTLQKLVLTSDLKELEPRDVCLSQNLILISASCPHLRSVIVYNILSKRDIRFIYHFGLRLDKDQCLLVNKRWGKGKDFEKLKSDIWWGDFS